MENKTFRIALNCAQKPNRGLAYENDLTVYNTLTREPWLAGLVNRIHNGEESLKDELPVRCSHYYRYRDNHRRGRVQEPGPSGADVPARAGDRDRRSGLLRLRGADLSGLPGRP